MKKFIFVAFFAVCSIGFANVPEAFNLDDVNIEVLELKTDNAVIDENHEFMFCQCRCSFTVYINGIGDVTLYNYTNSAQTCSSMTSGYGTFDSNDCYDTAGMLNANSVEEYRAAASGTGC